MSTSPHGTVAAARRGTVALARDLADICLGSRWNPGRFASFDQDTGMRKDLWYGVRGAGV